MALETLADEFYAARRDRRLAAVAAELSLGEGLAVQLEVSQRFVADGESIGGWKIAFSAGKGRDLLGKDYRPGGFVLASRTFASGSSIALSPGLARLLEPEVALVLGMPLAGTSVTRDEARAAVVRVAPSFELVELRTPGGLAGDPGLLVADAIGQSAVVLGSALPVDELPPRLGVVLSRDGDVVTTATAGETLELDDPFLSLARFASLLGEHGARLEAGQVVLTGALAAHPITEPGVWHASFADLGDVTMTLVG